MSLSRNAQIGSAAVPALAALDFRSITIISHAIGGFLCTSGLERIVPEDAHSLCKSNARFTREVMGGDLANEER